MSFILDALRKSENERQRNATPGIADAPVRQRSNKRSVWLPIVAVLLGVNLSLVAVLWYTSDRNAAPTATAAAPVAVTPSPAPVPAASVRPVADPNVSRELSAELDMPSEPAPTADSPPVTAANSARSPQAPVETARNTRVVDVPTLAELTLDGAISVPNLHLDIHVYSDTPAERFVFINTAKYREGEQTSEGPVIEEINPIGVILKHQNRRFLLTRE